MASLNVFMKTLVSTILAVNLFISMTTNVNADEDGYKAVIQISSSDERAHRRALNQVGWILDEFKFEDLSDDIALEVVAIGPAFNLLARDGKFANNVKKLMERGVIFTADASIQKMMKKHKLSTDLVAGVKYVEVGPAHIVRLQMQDYKYLALFF
jgi:intracellular sulfur oxidation DsrE/DsrF family protein